MNMLTNRMQSSNHQCYCVIWKKKKTSLQELKEAPFISVLIDSSNHLDEELVPLIVKYFHAERGMMFKVLELVYLGGETSDLLLS
jgi:hypothetical protein